MLYITLVISQLKFASTVWNSIKSTDSKNWEASNRNLHPSALIISFSLTLYIYAYTSQQIKLHNLGKRRYISLLEAGGFRVTVQYIRDHSMFNTPFVIKKNLSARCASAARVVWKNEGTKTPPLNHILLLYFLIISY
jgi:hypothetical protein